MTTQNHFRRKTLIGFAFLLILTGIGCFFAGRYAGSHHTDTGESLFNPADDLSAESINLRYNKLKKSHPEYKDENLKFLSELRISELIMTNNVSGALVANNINTRIISEKDAQILKKDYKKDFGYYIKVDTSSNPRLTRETQLDAWIIALDSIKALTDQMPKELLLIPVMKPEETQPQGGGTKSSDRYISIIVAAVDRENRIIRNPVSKEAILYEYLKPCPRNCPVNYDTIFPY